VGNSDKLLVARATANGTMDTTFSGDGVAEVLKPQVTPVSDFVDVVVQPSGRVVAVGTAGFGSGFDVLLVSLTPAGAPDPTFHSTNMPADQVGLYGSFNDVLVLNDGRILAVGYSTSQPGMPQTNDVYLARFLPNGALDPSFGSGGKVLVDFGTGSDAANRVALQSDGKILVNGNVLARFLPNGTLDTTFGGGDGFVPTGFLSHRAWRCRPTTGSSPATGSRGPSPATRATAPSTTTFANGGTFTDFGATGVESFHPTDVAVQPTTGKIIVGGNGYTPEGNEDWWSYASMATARSTRHSATATAPPAKTPTPSTSAGGSPSARPTG
jgi:uncharacterized delta-60 repeat protein